MSLILFQDGDADAITLDGGDIFRAGLAPYNLHPIIAEDYGASTSNSCPPFYDQVGLLLVF